MFESGVLLLPIAPVVGGLCRVVGASLLQTTAVILLSLALLKWHR